MKPIIIDTHCHPQFPHYDKDREEMLMRAVKKGIGMICVGTDNETSRQAIELSEQYEGLYASIGIHPTAEGELQESLAQHPKVVGIGECGLDYFRATNRDAQMSSFLKQLACAEKFQKPLIIHCRDAHDEMLATLRGRNIRGVIHSFNGNIDIARSYLHEGLFIGLNGIMTFSDTYVPMIRSLPIERIVIETDSPYLSPNPYRGMRNEPLHVEAVGNYIAGILGMSSVRFFSQTTLNAKTLFGI